MFADMDKNDITFANGRCSKAFAIFDEKKLRPFLIRNYTLENVKNQDDYNDMITKKFDDAEPEEMQNQIDEMTLKTRKMSANVSMIRNTLTARNSYVGRATNANRAKVDRTESIPKFGISMA